MLRCVTTNTLASRWARGLAVARNSATSCSTSIDEAALDHMPLSFVCQPFTITAAESIAYFDQQSYRTSFRLTGGRERQQEEGTHAGHFSRDMNHSGCRSYSRQETAGRLDLSGCSWQHAQCRSSPQALGRGCKIPTAHVLIQLRTTL